MESALWIEVEDTHVQRVLAHVISNIDNPSGLMRAIGYAMRTSTLRKFDEERGPHGHWAPLAESTIEGRRDVRKATTEMGTRKTARGRARAAERRRKAISGIKILQDTGGMKRSIHAVPELLSVDIGTNVFHSPFHQDGAPRAHIPARPYLYIDRDDAARIEGLALNYLARSLE